MGVASCLIIDKLNFLPREPPLCPFLVRIPHTCLHTPGQLVIWVGATPVIGVVCLGFPLDSENTLIQPLTLVWNW